MIDRLLQIAAAETDVSAHAFALYTMASAPGMGAIVELGVRDGNSTIALLLGVLSVNSYLTSYDIDAKCQELVKSRSDWFPTLSKRWDFYPEDSVRAASLWNRNSVRLLFVDTDHTYDLTRRELEAWLPAIAPIGLLCGHDYDIPDDNSGVKRAVDEFAAKHSDRFKMFVLPHDWGLWVLCPCAQRTH